jgi:putative ABC transport system permease protein
MTTRQDFLTGWRQFWQNPSYGAVVVASLAIGLCVAVLLDYVAEHLAGRESYLAAPERTFQLELRYHDPGRTAAWQENVPVLFKPEIDKLGLPIESAIFYRNGVSMRAGNNVLSEHIAFVSPNFAAMAGSRTVAGSMADVLARPDAVALTERAAEQLFGRAGHVGDVLHVNGNTYQVLALLANPPTESEYDFDALASTESTAWADRKAALSSWGLHHGSLLIQTKPGADMAALTAALLAAYDRSPASANRPREWHFQGHVAELRLVSLARVVFDGANAGNEAPLIYGLRALAVLILLLAGSNYVNLSTVQALKRQREIGIRKALGASPARIIRQFLVESTLLATVSALIGLLLAWLVGPGLMKQLHQTVEFTVTLPTVSATLGVGLALGVLSGLYPAWVASRVLVAQALTGRDRQETASGLWLRRSLSTLQFGSAICLSTLGMVVLMQARHAADIPLGVDTRSMLLVEIPQGVKPE